MRGRLLGVVCLWLIVVSGLWAQEPDPLKIAGAATPGAPGGLRLSAIATGESVPRLIKFSWQLRDSLGQPRAGALGLTFALYEEQEGGAPLWLETQNVEADAEGGYSVLLGAESSEGLPLELFASGQARWLGFQVQGEPEHPRVLLVAVPYALRAVEADRLAGRDASEFLLAEQLEQQVKQTVETTLQEESETKRLLASPGGDATVTQVIGSGTPGRIAKFTGTETLGDSELFEDGSARIGFGTSAPTDKFHILNSATARFKFESNATTQGGSSGFVLRLNEVVDAHKEWLFLAEKQVAGAGTGQSTFLIRRRNPTATELITPFQINGAGHIIMQAGTPQGSQTLGRVAIGTFDPLEIFHITNPANARIRMDSNSTSQAASAGIVLQLNEVLDEQKRWFFIAEKTTAGAGTGTSNFLIRRSNPTGTEIITPFQITGPGNVIMQAGTTAGSQTPGNVGIGTSNPTAKLEVAGQVKISGGSPGAGKVLTSDAAGLASWATPTGGISGSGTATRVAFWDSSASLNSNTNLFWDNTNSRLGIGTTAPGTALEVAGQVKITGGTPGVGKVLTSDASGLASWTTPSGGVSGSGAATRVAFWDTSSSLSSNTNLFWDNTNSRLGIGTTAPGTALEVTGQVKITGGGQGVSGSGVATRVAFWSGSTALTSNANLFWDNTNLRLGIGTATPGSALEVTGQVKITGGSPGSGKVLTSDAGGLATWTTPAGGGTVTSIAASDGIAASPGSPITSSGTLSLDTTFTNALYARLGAVNTFTLPNVFNGGVTASTLSVDSPTLVVDAFNNRVGIAQGVPDSSLHVGTGPTDSRIRLGSTEWIEDGGDLLVNVSPWDLLVFSLFTDAFVEIGLPLPGGPQADLIVHGNSTVDGNSTVIGTKSAVVTLADKRTVALYSVESPQSWFEDFGNAPLRNGVGVVTLDPTFAMTVNTDLEYHVFLTPNGDCRGLYVAQKTPRSFEVRELGGGRSDIRFDYRIVALRRGFEDLRLEEFETVTEQRPEETPEQTQIRSRSADSNRAARRQRTTLRPVTPRPNQ